MSLPLVIQALVILLIYSILVLGFFTGWLRTKRYHPGRKIPVTRISILIPCRNEVGNIRQLAVLLNSQLYPKEILEIIWINDHSTDATVEILEELTRRYANMHFINLLDRAEGKKAALKAGMKLATGELILLTDADSRPPERWVLTMAKFFNDTGSDLILGPVVIDPALSPFEKIQKLEYLSLVASSIGAAGIGRPVMAQGPNIGVRATDYRSIVHDLDDRFVSGDDVFLLQAMKKLSGKKIRYVLNPDAIVRSKPAGSLSGFLRQRERWASKASGYKDAFMILTTLLVFMANLEILASFILALFGMVPIYFFAILLLIKIITDFPILIAAMKFFDCANLIIWLIPAQLLYPVYVTVAGILSQSRRVRWRRG
ncbi:MAG: glycosyltransferase [Bacteroidales bacterium]|jgi:cellulose synthase/poly-beta-1,6-N-acetylglucosamine synthase-like glycosyltransferase